MGKAVNTVLVIDQDRQIRRFIAASLELHGYSVNEAETGAAGLSTAALIRPDLIIVDPHLSDIGGVEVLGAIRSWTNVPSSLCRYWGMGRRDQ